MHKALISDLKDHSCYGFYTLTETNTKKSMDIKNGLETIPYRKV